MKTVLFSGRFTLLGPAGTLAAIGLLSFTAGATAQNSQTQSAGNQKPSAYGNAYQGVSQPPSEPILSDQDAALPPAAPASAPSDAPPSPGNTSTAQPYIAPAQSTPAASRPPATWQNPDYGMVEGPVAGGPAPSGSGPALQSHLYNPDDDIVLSVPESPNQLPAGTAFHARLLEGLAADSIRPGTPFTAQLTEDVVHMGTVVIPVGSYIHGRVTYVSAGRRIGGVSTMKLRPEEVVLPDGTHYIFHGVVTETAGSDTKTNGEGEVVAKGHPIRTGAGYGLTAGSGAVIGGVTAGPVGAVVGAGIGAGLMTVHWLRQESVAVLPAGSGVTFGLSVPLAITPSSVPATASVAAPVSSQPASSPPPATATYIEPKIQN